MISIRSYMSDLCIVCIGLGSGNCLVISSSAFIILERTQNRQVKGVMHPHNFPDSRHFENFNQLLDESANLKYFVKKKGKRNKILLSVVSIFKLSQTNFSGILPPDLRLGALPTP